MILANTTKLSHSISIPIIILLDLYLIQPFFTLTNSIITLNFCHCETYNHWDRFFNLIIINFMLSNVYAFENDTSTSTLMNITFLNKNAFNFKYANCGTTKKSWKCSTIIQMHCRIIKNLRVNKVTIITKRSLNHNDENDGDNILLHNIKRFFCLLLGGEFTIDSSTRFWKRGNK